MNIPLKNWQMLPESEFDLAQRISDCARDLDELRDLPGREQSVEQLHGIVHKLAGDRVGEIYAPDEELVAS